MATKAFQKIYTQLEAITKATVALKAQGISNDELAVVDGRLAQVVKTKGDLVTLQVFSGTEGIPTDAEVTFLGVPPTLKVSDELAGRFFDAYGKPLDGGPEVEGTEVQIGGPSVNPYKRRQPSQIIPTGIAGIDLNNTLVSGQKIPFFADPDQPYNNVMAQVALRADVDKIILGGMGLTNDDYLYFKHEFEAAGASFIHIVDLDGALAGHTANAEAISEIVKNVSIGTEIGGGIRTMEDIKSKLNLGLNRVIIGTKAVKEPQFIKEAIETFGADRVVIGDPNPDLFGNIFTTLNWKNLTLSAAFNYSLGNDIYNYQRSLLEGGSLFLNQTTAMSRRWTTEGQHTSIPRVAYGDPMGNSRFSDRWIEDGSYLRLSSVTLSYHIPIVSTYLQGITVWGNAANLFTISRYLGNNPDCVMSGSVLSQGIDRGQLSAGRSFSLGVNINL